VKMIPARLGTDLAVLCGYDSTGLSVVTILDMPVLGWTVDETGVAPVQPVVGGAMPPASPSTAPIVSPIWAHIVITPSATLELVGAARVDVYLPDNSFRGSFSAFLDFLAGNHDANRQIDGGQLVAEPLQLAWQAWAQRNTGSVVPGSLLRRSFQ
jgi:hypothetical protein